MWERIQRNILANGLTSRPIHLGLSLSLQDVRPFPVSYERMLPHNQRSISPAPRSSTTHRFRKAKATLPVRSFTHCDPQHIEWTTAPVVLDYDTYSHTASLKKSFVDLPRSLATALGIHSSIKIHGGGTNYVSMKRVSPTCIGAQALVLSSSPRMSEQTTMQAGTLTLIPALQLP